MNILEAMESGRPFRRAVEQEPCTWRKYHKLISGHRSKGLSFQSGKDSPTANGVFTVEDILATDWEVLVCEKCQGIAIEVSDSSGILTGCKCNFGESSIVYMDDGAGFVPLQPSPRDLEFQEEAELIRTQMQELLGAPHIWFDSVRTFPICDCGAEKAGCGGHSDWCKTNQK